MSRLRCAGVQGLRASSSLPFDGGEASVCHLGRFEDCRRSDQAGRAGRDLSREGPCCPIALRPRCPTTSHSPVRCRIGPGQPLAAAATRRSTQHCNGEASASPPALPAALDDCPCDRSAPRGRAGLCRRRTPAGTPPAPPAPPPASTASGQDTADLASAAEPCSPTCRPPAITRRQAAMPRRRSRHSRSAWRGFPVTRCTRLRRVSHSSSLARRRHMRSSMAPLPWWRGRAQPTPARPVCSPSSRLWRRRGTGSRTAHPRSRTLALGRSPMQRLACRPHTCSRTARCRPTPPNGRGASWRRCSHPRPLRCAREQPRPRAPLAPPRLCTLCSEH